MFVDCPHCHTSNAGAEGPSVSSLLCRSCGQLFTAPERAAAAATHTTLVAGKPVPVALTGDGITVQGARVASESAADLETQVTASPSALQPLPAGSLNTVVAVVPPLPPRPAREAAESEISSVVTGLSGLAWGGILGQMQGQWRGQWRAWGGGSPAQRLRRWVAAALVLVGFGFGLERLLGSPRGVPAFMREQQVLLVQAAASDASGPLLERGQAVTVLATTADFVQVRDLRGRTGYVPLARLQPQRPTTSPEQAFVDCAPGIGEVGNTACEARAEAQWDGCGSGCESHLDTQCAPACRRHYRACLASCRGDSPRPEPALQ